MAILNSELIKWLGYFVELLPANEKKITPYINCFVFHMPEFILNELTSKRISLCHYFASKFFFHLTFKFNCNYYFKC